MSTPNDMDSPPATYRWIDDEAGFTIQELAVVLVVGAMLVSFTLSLFLFADRIFVGWRGKHNIEAALAHSLDEISLDIIRSKHIVELTDSSLTLIQGLDKIVRYSYVHRRILRNGVALQNDDGLELRLRVRSEGVAKESPKILDI